MSFKIEHVLPFLSWMGSINRTTLRADLIAGFTGAVIVLPQGVAFATIAGLPPEYGLYTAMITPIIAALFGSSLHLISGPTTAISIVVFATVSHHAEPGTAEFVSLALTLTFLAGVYQFIFGVGRMGHLVNFVSHTVVVGFTAGAAILIATSQIKNLLGIEIPRGESFLNTWIDVWKGAGGSNLFVLAVAMVTLLTAILIKRFYPLLPHLLIALIVGSAFAFVINGEANGVSFVGEIPAQLPPLSMPDFSYGTIRTLAPEAFAVALLGLIEAVSIGRSIATKSHQRIDGNQEFIGQGLSNIAGSFLSCYAGSGSFTRSGINYASGAKTPLSGIFAAVILMLIVVLIAPWSRFIPVGAMAGVIMLVAWGLIDQGQIKHVLESSKTETVILLTTFFGTLFLELEFAIYLGVLLSLVIFLARTSTPDIVTLAPDIDPLYHKHALVDVTTKPVMQCPELKILRIDMSIYFGSLDHVQSKIHKITKRDKVYDILIIAEGINLIDLAGTEMLLHEAERLDAMGGGLYFAAIKPAVYESISKTHLINGIGNAHFFDDKKEAIIKLSRLIRMQGRCQNCTARVFKECRDWAAKEAAEAAEAAQ